MLLQSSTRHLSFSSIFDSLRNKKMNLNFQFEVERNGSESTDAVSENIHLMNI